MSMTKESHIKGKVFLPESVKYNLEVQKRFKVAPIKKHNFSHSCKASEVTEYLAKQKAARIAQPTLRYIPCSNTDVLLFTR